jgi:alpha-mannosidase
VYIDAEAIYAEVKRDGEALVEEAFSVLFPKSVPLTPATTSKPLAGSCKIVAYNTTFFPRWEIIKVPLTKGGSPLKYQILQASEDGREGYAVMHCARGAGLGEPESSSNTLHAHLKPVSGEESFILIRDFKF